MAEPEGSCWTTRGTGLLAAGAPEVSEELGEEDDEVWAKAGVRLALKSSDVPRLKVASRTCLLARNANPDRRVWEKESTQGFSTIRQGLGKPQFCTRSLFLGADGDAGEGNDGTAADRHAECAGGLKNAAEELAGDLRPHFFVLRTGND